MTINRQGKRTDLDNNVIEVGYAEACCDEYGWVLNSSGLPVDPAVRCSSHPGKRGATKKPAEPAPADAPDLRDGNKNKFAWFYEMLADPSVSLAAKVVGTGCCMKMAGRKGHFKATRKAIANLCGISQSTVRRGLADLIDKRFLDADVAEGAANTYHFILPAQRLAQWLVAEKEYEREIASAAHAISNWLYAEKKYRDEQMEFKFRRAVLVASVKRGAAFDHAQRIAERLVAQYRDKGLELDVEQGLATIARSKDEAFTPATPAAENPPSGDPESDHERADPGTPESRPRYAREPTPVRQRADPGTPESRPRLTLEATTSGDEQTHKSFKDSERPIKVFQDSESEPALRDALTRALRPVRPGAGACELCGADGLFRDLDGFPVVLTEWDDEDNFTEHPVACQHSMANNLAEIQRREVLGRLELCKTGWSEIDAHYPLFSDGVN